MNTFALPIASLQSAAHLLIHATDDPGASRKYFETPLRWLLSLCSDRPMHNGRTPLRLRISDAQGSQVLTLDDAGALVDLALPAGTYHVTARAGDVRRGYTMTLEQGSSVDLYMSLAVERQ